MCAHSLRTPPGVPATAVRPSRLAQPERPLAVRDRPGDSGLERGLLTRDLERQILVPFPPESELSGIGDTDFLEAVWYRRVLTLPADWAGRRVLLHFGAVDHDTTVWANGTEVARHRGGFTPFTADLGDIAGSGQDVVVTVRARDPRSGPQARGKQAIKYANHDCNYTRVTGIWQTVWLEPVHEAHLRRPRITRIWPAPPSTWSSRCPGTVRARWCARY